jgi:hypothetical protein
MPEALILEFTGVALAAGGVTAPPRVRWVPLVAYRQPGA